ncbi:MAG: phosphate transporter permease subunit PstC, partial [Verrucomicrobiota bacterium]
MTETETPAVAAPFAVKKRRLRLLGVTLDDAIKAFFGGNAVVSVIVLALITIFLFREGAGFFGQNRLNLQVYRLAGLEYVDLIRRQSDDHTALTRYLSDIRLRALQAHVGGGKLTLEEANAALAPFDEFSGQFSDAVDPIRSMVSDLTDRVTAVKTKFVVGEDRKVERQQLLDEGNAGGAAKVEIVPVDFAAEVMPLRATLPAYRAANRELAAKLAELLGQTPVLAGPELEARMDRFRALTRDYLASFAVVERNLETWDPLQPVPAWRALSAFVFGREWLTASFWQDWYGIVPLFAGSFMVSLVALALAVPFGVGAAIYVNQVASPAEKRFI